MRILCQSESERLSECVRGAETLPPRRWKKKGERALDTCATDRLYPRSLQGCIFWVCGSFGFCVFLSGATDTVKCESVIHRVGWTQMTKQPQLTQAKQAVLGIQNPEDEAFTAWEKNSGVLNIPLPFCSPRVSMFWQFNPRLLPISGLPEPSVAKPGDEIWSANDSNPWFQRQQLIEKECQERCLSNDGCMPLKESKDGRETGT